MRYGAFFISDEGDPITHVKAAMLYSNRGFFAPNTYCCKTVAWLADPNC